jgi:glycosyltransferase involved in cell wall biosynthesis
LQVSSNFVRDEIKKYYPGQTANINFRVIPEGYSSSELESVIPCNPKIVQKFRIIFPANYWPHKDHITFLKAIASLKNEYELDVICTGSTFGKDAEINSILAHLGLGNVKFLGYLTRAELIKLYKSSHVVISCSMYESSSLPIIEGAVLGCIPIASNIAPHVEMSKRLTLELFELGNSLDLERVLRGVFGRIIKADNQVFNVNSIAVKDISWESLVPQYLEMLEKEVAEGNSK